MIMFLLYIWVWENYLYLFTTYESRISLPSLKISILNDIYVIHMIIIMKYYEKCKLFTY